MLKDEMQIFIQYKEKADEDLIFDIFNIVMQRKSSDMAELFKALGMEGFLKVLNLFQGRTIDYATLREFEESLYVSLFYYYRKVKNMSWKKVKEKVGFDFSTKEYGAKLNNLDSFIVEKLNKLFEEVIEDE